MASRARKENETYDGYRNALAAEDRLARKYLRGRKTVNDRGLNMKEKIEAQKQLVEKLKTEHKAPTKTPGVAQSLKKLLTHRRKGG